MPPGWGNQIEPLIPSKAENVAEKVDDGANNFCYEPLHLFTKKGHAYSILSRSSGEVPGPRIVLQLTGSDKPILNPVAAEFPKTIPVKMLRWEDAQVLFGESQNGQNGAKVFHLIYANQPRECEEMYQLETRFVNGKLTSYRVTGNGINNQEWTNAQ